MSQIKHKNIIFDKNVGLQWSDILRMDNICCIYKITSPSNKIYVGKTKDLKERLKKYFSLTSKSQKRLHNSFVKYGVKNHNFEILEHCEVEDLNNREIFYIKELNCFNTKNGLNLRSGGEGGSLTDEAKKKMSDDRKGKPNVYALKKQSDEHIRRRIEHRIGVPMSKEQREKLSKLKTGVPSKFKGIARSEEVKKKISQKLIGSKLSDETKLKLSFARKGKSKSVEHNEKNSKAKIEFYKNISEEKKKDNSEKISNGIRRYHEDIRQQRALMIF